MNTTTNRPTSTNPASKLAVVWLRCHRCAVSQSRFEVTGGLPDRARCPLCSRIARAEPA